MPTMPESFDPSQMQGGFGDQRPNMGAMPEGFDLSQMPGSFGGNFGMNNMGTSTGAVSGWIWTAVSVLILGAGLIIVKVYKY